jgi:hypothetical protein
MFKELAGHRGPFGFEPLMLNFSPSLLYGAFTEMSALFSAILFASKTILSEIKTPIGYCLIPFTDKKEKTEKRVIPHSRADSSSQ